MPRQTHMKQPQTKHFHTITRKGYMEGTREEEKWAQGFGSGTRSNAPLQSQMGV